jgi:hypothetical protein
VDTIAQGPARATSPPGPVSRAAGALAGGAAVVGQVPLWAWWAVTDAGGSDSHALAGAIYLAALAVVLAIAEPPAAIRGPHGLVVAAMGGLAAWAGVSMLWAPDAGAAWGAACQAAVPALAVTLPILWRPSAPGAAVGAGALTAVAILAGVVGLVRGADDATALLDGRLTQPAGYPNAVACLLAMGALVPLWAAAHARLRPAGRGALCGPAAIAAALGLLSQSRGAAAALAVVLLGAFAFAPARWRFAALFVAVAAAVVAFSGPLLDLRLAILGGRPDHAALRAGLASVGAGLLAAGLGAAASWAGDRLARRVTLPRVGRTGRRAAAAVGALAAIALFLVVTSGDPAGWIRERVNSLETPHYGVLESTGSSTRFTGDLGSDRTDYWRVALRLARDNPLGGKGAGSFAEAYVGLRHVDRYPVFAHSAPLQVLAEGGVVGGLLLLAALGGLLVAMRRGLRAGRVGATLAGALLLPAAMLAVHGLVDWIGEIPLVTAPAAALAGAALGRAAQPAAARGRRVAVVVPAVVVAVAALPLLVSARYEEQAATVWHADPQRALTWLDRAAAWSPLASRPRVAEGIVALAAHDPARAQRAFTAARARDDLAWFAELQLGLLAAQRHDDAAAARHLAAAHRLNALEPVVRDALKRPMDPLVAARRILATPG